MTESSAIQIASVSGSFEGTESLEDSYGWTCCKMLEYHSLDGAPGKQSIPPHLSTVLWNEPSNHNAPLAAPKSGKCKMIRWFLALAVTGLLGLFALPMQASVEGPAARALAILIDELKNEGFEEITVSSRIFGGYVIEARNDDAALLVALDGHDFSPHLTELFDKDPQSGFFGSVRRPLDQTAQAILARYTSRLTTPQDPGPSMNLTGFMRGPDTAPITAGFSQERSITTTNNTAIIRQNETLGMLSPVTSITATSTEERSNRQATTTHSIDERVTFSTQQSSTVIQMNGANAFNSEVFTSPGSVRNNIIDNINNPTSDSSINQSTLIDQIANTTQTIVNNLPSGLPETFPSNIRDNITAVLSPPE